MPLAVTILTAFNAVLGIFMLLMLIFRDFRHIAERGLTPFDYIVLPLDAILTVGYLAAAAGLVMRQKWGYYIHLAMCVLTILNLPFCCCFGFVYTILGIVVAIKPAVRAWFGFPPKEAVPVSSPAPAQRRRDIEFPD